MLRRKHNNVFIRELEAKMHSIQQGYQLVTNSISWKITKPLCLVNRQVSLFHKQGAFARIKVMQKFAIRHFIAYSRNHPKLRSYLLIVAKKTGVYHFLISKLSNDQVSITQKNITYVQLPDAMKAFYNDLLSKLDNN